MKKIIFVFFSLAVPVLSLAQAVRINIHSTATTKPLGYIVAYDTHYGLLLRPHLHGLPAGIHGFHVHQYPDCSEQGKAAGGHLDPYHTYHHWGPYNPNGHLGDLSALIVNKQGQAQLPVLAPRLKVKDILNHAIMIHAGGDNYSDKPHLGGGGARIACGVIPKQANRHLKAPKKKYHAPMNELSYFNDKWDINS